jgi:ketosteroid isomerase-like protein
VAFCDEQGSLLAPDTPIATGKDAIAKVIANDFVHDKIMWHANKVGVARSGDLGYTSGTTEMNVKDASGKTVVYKGKYLTVWKKRYVQFRPASDPLNPSAILFAITNQSDDSLQWREITVRYIAARKRNPIF